MDLLELLSHPAWQGLSALVAVFIMILSVVRKFIPYLFYNYNINVPTYIYIIKFFAALTLIVSFFLPFWCSGSNTCFFVNPVFYPFFCSSSPCSSLYSSVTGNSLNLNEILIVCGIFIWPILFLLSHILSDKFLKIFLTIIEPLFLLGTLSFYVILLINEGIKMIYQEASVGFYIGVSSVIIYFIAILLYSGNQITFFIRLILIIIGSYWLIQWWINILAN